MSATPGGKSGAEADALAVGAPISEQEFQSSWRALGGWKKLLVFWGAAIFAAFHLLNLNYLALDSILFRLVHFGGGAALAFVMVSSGTSAERSSRAGRVVIGACLFVPVYLAAYYLLFRDLEFFDARYFAPLASEAGLGKIARFFAAEHLPRRLVLLAGAVLLVIVVAAVKPRRSDRVPWYDWALALLALVVAGYLAWDVSEWQGRIGNGQTTTLDFAAALVGTLLVLEFTRRTAGIALTIIAFLFIIYGFAFIGRIMPGALAHSGKPFDDWFVQIFSENGVFGQTLEVSSTFIMLFVIFGAFLQRSGAGDYFNDLSVALVGWARGGPAKVAVISGALFGSISGSSVANVVASGAITIPMMRRVGYDRATAAAIEATSSTGGQITPPVLGAGAFIMAQVLNIKYAEIAWAAVIPCILFYVANYAHCHLHALRHGLKGIPRAELPRVVPMLGKLYYLAPVAILIYAFIFGFSPFRAASLAMIASILVTLALMGSQPGPLPRALKTFLVAAAIALAALELALLSDYDTLPLPFIGEQSIFYTLAIAALGLGILAGFLDWRLRGEDKTPFGFIGLARTFEGGTKDALQLIAVCAAAGIVAGAIATTGIGQRVSYVMLSVAGESKLLALLFTAVIVTILGMGMPTTAAYAIAASVVAPGLIRIGVEPLIAHMFIFFYAILSAITPPVAVASFAAAAMARADPWRTSWLAVRNGLACFLVPFLFFYAPVLLGQGGWQHTIQALATAILGVYFLACSTEGWLNGPLTVPLRAALIVASLCLVGADVMEIGTFRIPGYVADLGGLAIAMAIYAYQRARHGANPADKVPSPKLSAA